MNAITTHGGIYAKEIPAKVYQIDTKILDDREEEFDLKITYELSGGWLRQVVTRYEVSIPKEAIIDVSDIDFFVRCLIREENQGHYWDLDIDAEIDLTLI